LYNTEPLPNGLIASNFSQKGLLVNDGENVLIGQPYLESVKIKGKILEHFRGKKTIVYKMRPKKKTRKKQGHRQELTRVFIEDIIMN